MPILAQDDVAVAGLVIATAVIVSSFVYFMPTIIAGLRGHKSGCGIAVVNILLGWTLIGWVIALAWSCAADE